MKKNNKQQPGVDGVTQRVRVRRVGSFDDVSSRTRRKQPVQAPQSNQKVGFSEKANKHSISADLDAPQDQSSATGFRARRKARRALKKERRQNRSFAWRLVRRVGLVSSLAVVLLLGILGLKTWLAFQQIIDRGGEGAIALQSGIDPSQLKGEGDGRVNILLIGIGGANHEAGELADTIIVASIDPFAKELGMLSVPRDLYVAIPGQYSTKINAAHALGTTAENPAGGIALLRETIQQTLDIPIHYYARVDFDGFIKAVDTVGGIDVELDQRVYDPNFSWHYGTNVLDLPAGQNHLDGLTALMLARARGARGGLGVARGDFGRGDQQRKMILALKDKVFSAGTFANPTKIAGLIDTVGSHARTDLQVSDMLRLYEIVETIPEEKIISVGLDDGPDNYLRSDNINGAAVLVPKTGDFLKIQNFVKEIFVDGFIRQESPTIDVLNGSEVLGLAQAKASELRVYGYQIQRIANADTALYESTLVYDLSEGKKPFTKQLLEQRFGLIMRPASELPEGITSNADYVVIVGSDASIEPQN